MKLPRSVDGIFIYEEQSCRSLKFRDIRGETENMFMVFLSPFIVPLVLLQTIRTRMSLTNGF